MKQPVSIPTLISSFAATQNTLFSFEQLEKYVRRKAGPIDPDELFDQACLCPDLFAEELEMFLPRRVFFQSWEFRITPLPYEVEHAVLIPGHRLIPFIAPNIFPADAQLVLANGLLLPTKVIQMTPEEITPFLLFYGPSGTVNYLAADHTENAEKWRPSSHQKVDVTVFDMSQFFADCNFQHGDSLLLNVADWQTGVYTVHPMADQTILDLSAAARWTAALREAYDSLRDTPCVPLNCSEQMAQMLWIAQKNPEAPQMGINPPLSLAAFFSAQSDLTLLPFGAEVFFWPRNEDPADILQQTLDRFPGPAADSELEELLQDQNLSLDCEEAAAYMRDALFHGQTDPMAVLARIIQGRQLLFFSPEEQQRFYELWRNQWETIRQNYSIRKDHSGPIRSEFLKLNDQCLALLRELDRRKIPQKKLLSNPAFMKLNQISALLSEGLLQFNASDAQPEAGPDVLSSVVAPLAKAIEKLEECLLADFAAPPKAPSKRVPKKDKMLQLKITLLDTDPPIWRRVLVPSSLPLEALHDVIQCAMGWSNSHLHNFRKDNTLYEARPERPNVQNSMDFSIAELLPRTKSRLIYEYDFGDSWQHEVLVEKTTDRTPDQTHPVCIDGEQACPPEDCGGVPGYYHLLTILKNPRHPEHASIKQWLGGTINPAKFDIKKANVRLKKSF